MKRAMSFLAAALTVSLLTVQAHAAGIHPVYEETYTYGPFDELRIDKVYELSPSDDPADIPTEDFDRDGYHYTLLCVVMSDQSETGNEGQAAAAGSDTVIYTATFACRGEAKTSISPSPVPFGQNQPEGTGSFDLPPQIVLLILLGMMGLILGGKSIYQYIKSKKGV